MQLWKAIAVVYFYVIYLFTLKDFFGKSDPYLEFSRAKEDGSFVVFHRTEVTYCI